MSINPTIQKRSGSIGLAQFELVISVLDSIILPRTFNVMNDFLYHYKARVLSVYDGDTIRVSIDLGFGIQWKGSDGNGLSIRLFGLNAPEIRGEERDEGLISRDALRDKILDKTIVLKTIKDATEKYGRYLGIILTDEGQNINDWLIENGYAEAREY